MAIERGAASVLVSAASGWELAIKTQSGRLRLRQAVGVWMPAPLADSGFGILDATMAHALAVADLPPCHADPFDRLLIVQAKLEGLTVVTSDAVFDGYDVRLLDARA